MAKVRLGCYIVKKAKGPFHIESSRIYKVPMADTSDFIET